MMQSLTEAHSILLAAQLCSHTEIEALRALRADRSDVLSPEIVCRILLTFLPEETDPTTYIPLLKDLQNKTEIYGGDIDTSSVDELSEANARARVAQLHLQKVRSAQSAQTTTETDLLVRFLILRAHQIDAATSDIPAVLQLVEPFVHDFEELRTWLISRVVPLLRRDYEYYPENMAKLSLRDVEALQGSAGVDTILHHAKETSARSSIGRDLRGLVGPWKYGDTPSKRRKTSQSEKNGVAESKGPSQILPEWQDVNQWILSTSQMDHQLTSKAIAEWDGPGDVDLGGYGKDIKEDFDEELTSRYGQAALATIYAAEGASQKLVQDCWHTLERVTAFSQIETSCNRPSSSSRPSIPAFTQPIVESTRAALLHSALLLPDNYLTRPSQSSVEFLTGLCCSLDLLHELQHPISPRAATELCLFDSEQRQQQELQRLLQQLTRTIGLDADWRSIREKLLWLQSWVNPTQAAFPATPEGFSRRAMFWRVDVRSLEIAFLKTLLTATQYQTIIDIYLKGEKQVLGLQEVEDCIHESILNLYDNASNGNRTRGVMKRASETLRAFQPHFPKSSPIHKLEHLIAATHALSFYQLTLQHGVPFRPVSIRVHQDPLSLLERVLEQNSKAYTKLDDLLFIGRSLVAAGLPASPKVLSQSADPETNDSKTFDAEHRITYLAITSALSSNDFDTAYSYILTRLSPSSIPKTTKFVDDTSWRAAYAAGRHRPPSSPQPLASRITNLSKRMELLSLALMLAPTPEPLSEILGTWRRCEEEMGSLRAQEAQQEHAWDDRGDGSVPGGFAPDGRDVDMADTKREREKRANTRKATGFEDEAPVGLFDVARGAARAIGKNAFPLRHRQDLMQTKDQTGGFESDHELGADGQRVRKRDVVSNLVTGGLKSGLGWVLGAQPLNEE